MFSARGASPSPKREPLYADGCPPANLSAATATDRGDRVEFWLGQYAAPDEPGRRLACPVRLNSYSLPYHNRRRLASPTASAASRVKQSVLRL
jgi:hypothetical protein